MYEIRIPCQTGIIDTAEMPNASFKNLLIC